MTGGTKSTWNRSRTAASEAVKAKTRATFYREAPQKQLVKYWCYGLEKTPGFLMKMAPFQTALQALRVRHSKEIMLLSADFLDKEVATQNECAGMMKAAAIQLIYDKNQRDVADKIVREASTSYDITISNMASNEYKEFERRRRTLEESPSPPHPTAGDILNPAANVAKSSLKTSTSSNNTPRGGSNQGFPQRGRGNRGGSRPWRGRGARKPYSRPEKK